MNFLLPYSRLLAVGAAVIALTILIAMRRRHSRSRLPPGPPLESIIGGLRSMPSSYQWLTFGEWSKAWGDVIYTSLFGRPVVVLNSIDAARDLLDKRSANYSSRPSSVVWNDLLNWDTVISMPYGDRFRKHRRLMKQVLNSQAILVYRDFQTNNTKQLLKNLLNGPEKFEQHILRQAYTTLIRLTYGLNVVSDNDDLISIFAETIFQLIKEGTPGISIIDLFPILKYVPSWFPGGGFQKRIKTTRTCLKDAKNVPFERVRAARRAGTAKPSLLGMLLDDCDSSGTLDLVHEYDLKMVGAVMYAAGVEITFVTMMIFFQMMAKYPDVVKRAHLEIDSITQKTRLPTLDDRTDLPIVDCIMKEVFRINPPAPLGVPHASLEEDTYRDMRIPANSTIIYNLWQMMRDPNYFPNPDTFDPERFREKVERLEGNSLKVLNGMDNDDPSAIVFGFGRRVCPGRYFVDANLWLLMSHILAVFDIGPPLDSLGNPQIIGEIRYTSGATSRPEPFECIIRPRDAKCEALIQGLEVEIDL